MSCTVRSNRLLETVTNVPAGLKRPLESHNANVAVNNGKRKRTTNSLINNTNKESTKKSALAAPSKQNPFARDSTNENQPCAVEGICPPPSKKGKSSRVSSVTEFDTKRAKHLPGLYMPEEYIDSIVDTMNESSSGVRAEDYFASVQTDIKPRMRTILCGWLTEVVARFEMKPIVLWQTFQIMDRYLATTDIKRDHFQLVGCASMWIASKFQEIYPPVSADLVHMSDGAFDKEQLIRMEEDICDKLDYEFTMKTCFQFLDRYTDIALHGLSPMAHKCLDAHMKDNPTSTDVSSTVKKAKRVKFLARYAMERYNLITDSVGRPPKHVAAMALFTSLSLTSNSWTTELARATGFTAAELRSADFPGGTFKAFKAVVLDFSSDQHKAVIRKYRNPECGGVSTLRKRQPKR